MHGRGSYNEWETQVEDTKITAVKWMDNRSVHLASSFLNSSPMDKCVRYEKKLKEKVEFPRPNIVKEYNIHMGGVDLCDQMLSYYRMYFRSKKYYHRFIFHLIDLPVVNSWMLYRRDGEALKLKKQIPLYEFKFKLASSLMLAGKNVTRERGRPSIRVENAFRKKKSWKGNKKHSRKRCKDRWHWPLSSFLGKKELNVNCRGAMAKYRCTA